MKKILCEVCHERPATNHICDGNTGKSSDLCAECFESSAPPEVRQSFAAIREAHCQYCGGKACDGGTDFLALLTGVQLMCMPCSLEHNRYIRQELRHLNKNKSQPEQMESLRELNIAADEHMKLWVLDRDAQ